MDELSRIWFRTQCRDRLRNAQGTTFQDLFADLMELAFPSLLRMGRRKEALVATLLTDWPTPGFAEELAEGYRQRYAELKALSGITADEIFGSLLQTDSVS